MCLCVNVTVVNALCSEPERQVSVLAKSNNTSGSLNTVKPWFEDSRPTSISSLEKGAGGWGRKREENPQFWYQDISVGLKTTLIDFMFASVLLGRQSFSHSTSMLQSGSTREMFVFSMSRSRSLFTVTAHFFRCWRNNRGGFFSRRYFSHCLLTRWK